MRISLYILLSYFLILGLAAYLVMNVISSEVKPGVRQALEETLVDTANLLAELAVPEMVAGKLPSGAFSQALTRYQRRPINARIWNVEKRKTDYQIYLTDTKGIVLLSTNPATVGSDFSRWRDVYLTLRGEYGARSTRQSPDDALSSVM